jgi:hypothetical protein
MGQPTGGIITSLNESFKFLEKIEDSLHSRIVSPTVPPPKSPRIRPLFDSSDPANSIRKIGTDLRLLCDKIIGDYEGLVGDALYADDCEAKLRKVEARRAAVSSWVAKYETYRLLKSRNDVAIEALEGQRPRIRISSTIPSVLDKEAAKGRVSDAVSAIKDAIDESARAKAARVSAVPLPPPPPPLPPPDTPTVDLIVRAGGLVGSLLSRLF